VKNFTVRRYQPADSGLWNSFIANAKNATFLFHREFMDYHSDRFDDYSLLVFDEARLLCVIPAHKAEATVFSHSGLTYGGFVYDVKIKLKQVIDVLKSVLLYLSHNGISKLHVKMMPAIYHLFPSGEIDYAFFLAQAKLLRRDTLAVIDLLHPLPFSKDRKQSIRRGIANGLHIKEETAFEAFWNDILIPNLQKKHSVKPVHSLAEIESLHKKFPENIRQFNVYKNHEMVAGTTVFVSQNVAHPQYISGRVDKNALGSLDFLYNHLIVDVFKDKRFFDFGISNEEQGRKLNEGLIFWKESFGARTITQDFYEVETDNSKWLENVLL
jgi:hypothetical protein